CHQHARRTEPALQAVMVPEGLLQRMQLVRGSQALDRTELGTVRLHGEHQTRADGAAVHLDRARPTDPVLASEVQAGESEILAQEVTQQEAWLDLALVLHAVDGDRDPMLLAHDAFSSHAVARCAAAFTARLVNTPTRWRRKSAEA